MNKKTEQVELKPLQQKTISITIEGTNDLIVHNWSEKAKRMMLDKQMKKTTAKQSKDPQEDFISSKYFDENGKDAFPVYGIKAAIVAACRLFDDKASLPMTKIRSAIYIHGALLPINGECYIREDMVRLQTGVADIRYRAAYRNWSISFDVTFIENILSAELLVNLISAAGFCGLGEWRPNAPKSNSGQFGTFRVRV